MINEFSHDEAIYSFSINPSDTNRIYAGGCYYNGIDNIMAFYRSTNGGSNWTKKEFSSPIHDYGYIYSIAVDPQCPDTIYAGGRYTYAGNTHPALFKSTDGGIIWSDLSSGLSGYGYTYHYISNLEVDPHNSGIVYAGTNYGIWKTTNGGSSWSKKGTLYDIYSVVVSPNYSGRVFAGGLNGAYYSPDGGNNWNYINQGLGCQYVTSMKFDPSDHSTIYASTYGAGLYKTTEETGVEEKQEVLIPKEISLSQNYPNPFNLSTTIPFHVSCKGQEASCKTPIHTTLTIYNILGQKVRTLVDELQKPKEKEYEVVWDGKDGYGQEVASGIYFYRIQAGDFVQTKKMLLIK